MTPTEMSHEIRRIVLERSFFAGVGHIGSALSVADILGSLYAPDGGALADHNPEDPDRNRFILSCGHKNLALLGALHLRGWISAAEMETFCQPGSELYTHPSHHVRGIEFSSGSLGMGLSFGCGAALAARMQGSKRKTYVLISDSELNEGSTWEAVMFAAHHKLSNLIAIVDVNGQQALGKTVDICDLGIVRSKFAAFGWHTEIRDLRGRTTSTGSSDADFIINDLGYMNRMKHGMPSILECQTTFGKGVSFMEQGGVDWHYKPMTEALYSLAMSEIEA